MTCAAIDMWTKQRNKPRKEEERKRFRFWSTRRMNASDARPIHKSFTLNSRSCLERNCTSGQSNCELRKFVQILWCCDDHIAHTWFAANRSTQICCLHLGCARCTVRYLFCLVRTVLCSFALYAFALFYSVWECFVSPLIARRKDARYSLYAFSECTSRVQGAC